MELVGAWADITERKSIETELSETRQRLQYLLSVSPAIIYTTKASGDFGCTFVSENLRAIMGYSPEEMTTDPKCWPDHLHPEDAARVFEEMAPSDRTRRRQRSNIASAIATAITSGSRTASRSSRTRTAIRASWSAPGPTSPRASAAEQAALKANIELQDTKRYLTRLIESSTDAIIATDKEGNVVLFNEGAETLLGYRAERGHRHARAPIFMPARSTPRTCCARCASAAAPSPASTSVLKTKDGASIPVLISASVLFDEQGEEVGTVGFATDLRTRKHEEEELRKAHDELEKRVDERTTELKAARERLRYLMTVTPAIVYTNQASDYTCTFVSENVSRIMGFSVVGDARGQGFLDRASASAGCLARLRGNGASGRKRRRDASNTASGTATGITSGSRTRSA